MKKLFVLLAVTFAVAACDRGADDSVLHQTCGDYDVEITYSSDGQTINTLINGDELTLENVVAASGARYDGVLNDTSVTLWQKGADWIMILDDDAVIECVAK